MNNKILENKIVMITGGTGSFGKEVSKFFIESNVFEVRIFSRDEKKQEDMRKDFNNPKLFQWVSGNFVFYGWYYAEASPASICLMRA